MEIVKSIITNILTALYQPFWFSLILSVFFMFVYKQYGLDDDASDNGESNTERRKLKRKGWKRAAADWISWFKSDCVFRRIFLLVFYTVMILFRTLLNRIMWLNPLTNVIGTWGIYNENGDLTTECIENLILFIPFSILLLWAYRKKAPEKKVTLGGVLWRATKITFLFSFLIEMLQLFLRLGTCQLSDLFYNTLGGAVGGVIYYLGYRLSADAPRR